MVAVSLKKKKNEKIIEIYKGTKNEFSKCASLSSMLDEYEQRTSNMDGIKDHDNDYTAHTVQRR